MAEILTNDDVFVVPVGKAIEYMLNPEPLDIIQLGLSEVFACDSYYPDPPALDCDIITNCPYCSPSKLGDAAAGRQGPNEYIMPVCGR